MKHLYIYLIGFLLITACSKKQDEKRTQEAIKNSEITESKDFKNDSIDIVQQKIQDVYDLLTTLDDASINAEIKTQTEEALQKLIISQDSIFITKGTKIESVTVDSVKKIDSIRSLQYVRFNEGKTPKRAILNIEKEKIKLEDDNKEVVNLKIKVAKIEDFKEK